ncbi:lasso peptide biosynthesis B2 protein [Rhizobium sullae]|uniref:Transglutaminase superfamily protein n=1 Tax=Rhizobium sullae TaxID=50338 RepID=A0A4R3QC20_RHISU|nr:lasso peptide biosynthesis B2 protein [Rhizobium sullae]TCU18197.1 transglutaminase superfamily protein [Rhizobium sullae]
MEVHLDLDQNRYSGIPLRQEPVDFCAMSSVFRDYSTHAFEASEDVLLFPRFQWVSLRARAYRWRSIKSIAKDAEKCTKKMAKMPATPHEDIAILIAIYNRLKTFRIFPLSCIPDSLACLFFLVNEGCKANFVIGVRENPFMAHAWLEINGAVANDVVANVFHYTPILETANEDYLRQVSG